MAYQSIRIPITRHDKDGKVIDGTAAYADRANGCEVFDFRDLGGHKLSLPPGSRFEFDIDMGEREEGM